MLGVFATLVTAISKRSEVVPIIQDACSNWLPYLRSLSQEELDALLDDRAIYKYDPNWPGKRLFCGYRELTDEEMDERDRKVKAWMEKERSKNE